MIPEFYRAKIHSRHDLVELVRRAQAGDRHAANLVATGMIAFVRMLVNQLRVGGHCHRDDLVAAGMLGITHAIQRFDPDRGIAFTSYARFWINAMLQRQRLADWSMVGFGGQVGQQDFYRRLREGSNMRLLPAAPIDELDIAPVASPEDQVIEVDFRTKMRSLRKKAGLTKREKQVLATRFDSDEKRTLAYIGKRMGVTREAIRVTEKKAIAKLRIAAQKNGLG